MRKCYNCGVPFSELSQKDRTKEHIPARTLFDGFPDDYKQNRITVPACRRCNDEYSSIDQEIRDLSAIWNDGAISKENLRKAVKSIISRRNWIDRTHLDVNGHVRAVEFSYSDLAQIHIKNFKGVFYRLYGYPIPKDHVIDLVTDGDTHEGALRAGVGIYEILDQFTEWRFSGHPDVFRFKIGFFHISGENSFVVNDNYEDAFAIAAILVYHDLVESVVVAVTPEIHGLLGYMYDNRKS